MQFCIATSNVTELWFPHKIFNKIQCVCVGKIFNSIGLEGNFLTWESTQETLVCYMILKPNSWKLPFFSLTQVQKVNSYHFFSTLNDIVPKEVQWSGRYLFSNCKWKSPFCQAAVCVINTCNIWEVSLQLIPSLYFLLPSSFKVRMRWNLRPPQNSLAYVQP